MNTLIVNLFGAPGSGKSTLASLIFSKLKLKGFNAELVTEFAKDIIYAERHKELTIQPYIFGKQLLRIERLIGKVEYIITDSPLLLSIIYTTDKWPKSFMDTVFDIHQMYTNKNYLLIRNHKYLHLNRNQNEEESQIIHEKILKFLLDKGLRFQQFDTCNDSVDFLVECLTRREKSV